MTTRRRFLTTLPFALLLGGLIMVALSATGAASFFDELRAASVASWEGDYSSSDGLDDFVLTALGARGERHG